MCYSVDGRKYYALHCLLSILGWFCFIIVDIAWTIKLENSGAPVRYVTSIELAQSIFTRGSTLGYCQCIFYTLYKVHTVNNRGF